MSRKNLRFQVEELNKNESSIKEFYGVMTSSYAKHTLDLPSFLAEAKKENIKLFVIKDKGMIISTLSLVIENNDFYTSIHRVSTLGEYRNMGLATKMYKHAMTYSQKLGRKYIFCSAVINVEGKGGGNLPNLANLHINLYKLGYLPTGFRLLDLPDFGRIKDIQQTSTCVVWKPLINKYDYSKYLDSVEKLINFYKENNKMKIVANNKNIKKLNIIKYCEKTGVNLASSTNINNFVNSGYLPMYFLPNFESDRRNVYFGFNYKIILTRAYKGDNIADLNYKLLGHIIDKKWIWLVKKIQKQIALNFDIHYSKNFIKELNY